MNIELSPSVYIALCGLVQDALEHPSDAAVLLRRAVVELSNAKVNDAKFIKLAGPDGTGRPGSVG